MIERPPSKSIVNYGGILKQRLSDSGNPYRILAKQTNNAGEKAELTRLSKAPLVDLVASWWGLDKPKDASDLTVLLGACPDLTISYLERATSKNPDRPKRPSGSNFKHLSRAKATVWAGHGLSPTGDSIALLADIGRLYRMGTALGSTKIQIALAGPHWVSYSIAATRSASTIETLHHRHLQRQLLYRTAGLTDSDVEVWDIGSAPAGKQIYLTTLNEYVEDALQIYQALTTEQRNVLTRLTEQPLSADIGLPEITLFNQDILSYGTSVQRRLAIALAAELKKDLVAIEGAVEYLGEQSSGDESQATDLRALRTAMLYLVCQIHMQRSRSNTLKIGPETERLFDIPSNRMAQSDKPLVSLYLRHYEFARRRVLPYTALSIDVAKEEHWQNAHGDLILVEHREDADLQHITRVLDATSVHHRARLIADLASFTVHAVRDSSVRSALIKTWATIDEPMAEKMLAAATSKSLTRVAAAAFMQQDEETIPYWIMPFLWGKDDWKERYPALSNFVLALNRLFSNT